jgi:hypothetical protein
VNFATSIETEKKIRTVRDARSAPNSPLVPEINHESAAARVVTTRDGMSAPRHITLFEFSI